MTIEQQPIKVGIGMMSGTSLDGVDLAAVEFREDGYTFLATHHLAYRSAMMKALGESQNLNAEEFFKLEIDYSKYIANAVNELVEKHELKPDFLACHGHTVLHQPGSALTYQLGNGHILANETGITTICDFRRGDVANGGQGAPLVPIGDQLLFAKFRGCLNLGGFANISFDKNGARIAYDVCPANLPLNEIARSISLDYDDGGQLARSGKINAAVLRGMDALPYYHHTPPKSLGREWAELEILPKLTALEPVDALATFCEHIAIQIGRSLETFASNDCILTTGGGSLNAYLIDRIRHHSKPKIVIPDEHLVHFKEALIFAFLGKLRLEGKINTLSSVTGAKTDSSSGVIYYPPAPC